MRKAVKWTDLTRREISRRPGKQGTPACRGVMFHTTQIVKEPMEKTKTRTGLEVTVDIMDKVCEVGRKAARGFKEDTKIAFDSVLPRWNHRAIPTTS